MADRSCHVNDGSDLMTKNWPEVNSLNDRSLFFTAAWLKCSSLDIFLVFPAKMKSVKTEESDFLSGALFMVVVRAEPLFQSPAQDSDRTGGSCCFPLSLKAKFLLHHLQAAFCKANGQMY